jgi:hypothetical protein
VLDEGVKLHKALGIQQLVYPLPGREFFLLVLFGRPLAVGIADDRLLVFQRLVFSDILRKPNYIKSLLFRPHPRPLS